MTVELFKEKFGYEIEGVWFPRVTSITALSSGFSFLKAADPFGKRFGFQQAAEWGFQVHEAIESVLRGVDLEELQDRRLHLSVETFLQWKEQYPLHIEDPITDIEQRVMDVEEGYAGTVDLVAEIDGVRGIIDLKTGTSIVREHGLQTAAYLNAYNKMEANEGHTCDTRWILRIDQYEECEGCLAKRRAKYGYTKVTGGKEGCNHQWTPQKGEIEFKELQDQEKDLERFLELKGRWEWTNKEWLNKIPNYEKNIKQYSLL